ncbi:hypothetical protein [Endozoicomonas sp. SESOKO1]|uniref:hypothetical protein n=1 Tax=Endozoicomonas sp. SESOKO1 TaxID=2828742 RepID=UPI002148C3AA|nr:hypothetical protein [Endozoicomonas sp. SESOKO1]
MFTKQVYRSVIAGLLMVGGLFPATRALAESSGEQAPVPYVQYWDIIANHLAESLISRGRLGSDTVYVDKKHTASGVTRYLENQLSVSLRKSFMKVTAPTHARYIIELDVKIRERPNGMGTVYARGGDLDQLWKIEKFSPVYSGQKTRYEMTPLKMNRPVTINPIADTDREVIISARVMERGWILISQDYAFYFSTEQARRVNKPLPNRFPKAVNTAVEDDAHNDALFMDHQNQHSAFINQQKKLNDQIQQLIDINYPDVDF